MNIKVTIAKYKGVIIFLILFVFYFVILWGPAQNSRENLYQEARDEDGGLGYFTFAGHRCKTKSCSGHYSGYNWAIEKDISDPDDCSGRSDSFVEGCMVGVCASHYYQNIFANSSNCFLRY